MPDRSARAWSSVAPGASRPTARTKRPPRLAAAGSNPKGRNTSAVRSGSSSTWRYVVGSTPTTVYGSALTRTVAPTVPGAAANRRVQNPWLTSATRGAFGRSSSGVKRRPSAGCTPSVGKNASVTRTMPTRSASPSGPPIVAEPTNPCAPILLKVRVSRAKSRKSAGDRLPVCPSSVSKPITRTSWPGAA
jgi:hypothetical protein